MQTSKNNFEWEKSMISRKYPSTFRDHPFQNVQNWIAGKQAEDNAEGLWRIHNSLYDFTDFIKGHPGGEFWLNTTKGTDITEAFEIHHISKIPENMLKKFKIRDALEPRNITLTLHPNGFYKTLKSRVQNQLQHISFTPSNRSDIIHSVLLILTFGTAIASLYYNSNLLIIVAGLLLCWTVIASHNYFHRRDNWRMYTFNLSLMNFKDWRISHALSHHIYPNSYHDLEITMFEPYFCYIPSPYIKNIFQRYGSWIYGPILYTLLFLQTIIARIFYSIYKTNVLYKDDLVGLSIPFLMLITTNASLWTILLKWLELILISSFIFSLIGLNAAHHQPNIYHDGDNIHGDRDWGLYQLDTIIDNIDIKGSQFLILTHFGDHALHHLFPTLDHGVLSQLYPILFETLQEFHTELRECHLITHIIGQHQQLARIKPNLNLPGSIKLH